MVQRIDIFTHATPPKFRERMLEVHPTAELENLYFESLYDVDRRIQDMDEHGIDHQVISLANPPIWRGIDPGEALPLTELANDRMRAFADEYPDRLTPIATLPFVNEDYLAEFERCLDDLDMAGVQIFSNDRGRPIDSAEYFALYEAAAAADVPVWIHPQFHDWYDWLDEYEIHRTFGWPFDTTVAMARLVYSGVFNRFPELDVVTHHLGGMVPFYAGRVSTFYEARMNNPELYPHFDAPDLSPIEDHFRRFHGDTVVGGSTATLTCGREFFGDDRVVFATDYPFGPEAGRRFMQQAVDVVETIDDPEARSTILEGNARRLL